MDKYHIEESDVERTVWICMSGLDCNMEDGTFCKFSKDGFGEPDQCICKGCVEKPHFIPYSHFKAIVRAIEKEEND